MVMMAGTIRVRVSFALAWPKLLGDFDLRARCLFRSAMVRYFPISLVSASAPVLPARMAARIASARRCPAGPP